MRNENHMRKLSSIALSAALILCLHRIFWSPTQPAPDAPQAPQTSQFAASPHHSASTLQDGRKRNFARLRTPPTEIYVLGERNSGTNYAAGVLRRAFTPPPRADSTRQHEVFSSEIPVLRHKHMFRHSLLDGAELAAISERTDVVWILAVRSPCEWAEAMKRLPWHMCHPEDIASECPGKQFIGFEHATNLRNYSLAQFFEMEWGDWPESTNFRKLSFVGEDFIYRNVFQLRKHKLLLMKQIIETVPRNVKIVRLHELERSPQTFIEVR